MTTQEPTTWIIEGTFFGKPVTLEAHAQRYTDNGRIALPMFREDEDGEESLFSVLTVNVPRIALEDTQIIVDPNVTKDTLSMVVDSGLIDPAPVAEVQVGMATAKVYNLTADGAKWATTNATNQF